jgi:hypothetical protein
MDKKCFGCKKILNISRFKDDEKPDKIYSKCHSCRISLISKKNNCNICGIKAVFNYEGQKIGIKCSTHKEPTMIDIKNKKCEICKTKRPNFNYEGETHAKFCSHCKEPNMIDIKNKKCEKCKTKQPVFNYEEETQAKFCSDCKEPNMIDIKHKKCEKCKTKRPNFNYEGETQAKFCSDCKEPTMIDIKSRKCEKCKTKQPVFNYEGETQAKFCSDCKEPNMIDIKTRKCEKCKTKQPNFNYEGETQAKFCSDCKEPNMIDIKTRKCEKCKTKCPTFNYQGETQAKFCSDCKEPTMIDIKTRKCEKCKTKHPVFNYEGETQAKFCSDCKEPNMIDIKNKKCLEIGCRLQCKYAFPNVIPAYCSKHKKDGMMLNPRKKCLEQECKETATHGDNKIPMHCEDHSNENEYNLAERKCKNCDRIDILNKSGICINFCSLEETDRHLKKRVKKHEEFINSLLDEEVNMCVYSKDTVIDSSCSLYRPDRVYHCGTHIVIIEVDENQHKSYKNCGNTKEEKIQGEMRRMYLIGQSFDGLPCIFIRYNPDNYLDCNGKKGDISNTKRHDILVKWTRKCIKELDFIGYQVLYLFYDGYNQSSNSFLEIEENSLI